MNKLLSALALVVTITPAGAIEASKLTGNSWLGEESCAAGISAPDCVLTFSITGKAAEQLYQGMKVKAVVDECAETLLKDDGNGLRCYKEEKGNYSCDFGYSFSKKKFGPSEVIC